MPSKTSPAADEVAHDRPGCGAAPHRVRLSRKKGWRKPENTVVVSRPSKWGNPFTNLTKGPLGFLMPRQDAAALYDELLMTRARHLWPEIREKLAGKNLACWCPLDGPCHADVLLRLANAKDEHHNNQR